jgi:hypothetical protein
MERGNMRNSLKRISELNFENEQGMFDSAKIIRSEYLKKAFKSIACIIAILTVALSYLVFGYLPYLSNNSFNYLISGTYTLGSYIFSLNLTLSWALFSTSIFLVIYLTRTISLKFTPSLIRYIERETEHIGFEFKKRFESMGLFIILNVISIVILFYLDINAIHFNNTYLSLLFRNTFVTYLFISIMLPIIWIFKNDKFVIKVKENVFILCDLHYSLSKKEEYDPNLVGIILTSNRLCSKFDKSGKHIYSKISENRWLKKKDNSAISPYLRFQEFSVPFNFQKQFLNITLALNEWEDNYDSNLDLINYYISTSYPYYNKNMILKYPGENQLIFLKFLNQ